MLDKQAIMQRALQYHSPKGRVVTALKKVLNTEYPVGTNLIIKFLDEMIGLPYKHTTMRMDSGIDCAEMPRVAFYIFFGGDIGAQSYNQFDNPAGKVVATNWNDLPKCRPLTLAFYDTDDDARHRCDHVAVVHDSKRLIQSGASVTGSRVGLTDIMWHPKKAQGKFLCAKDFLTDEQYNSVTVQASEIPVPDTTVNYYTVKKGDSCWGISRKFGITLAQLRLWNPKINAVYLIYPDWELRVTPPDTYIVKQGDSCWKISRMFGLTLSQLRALNPQINEKNLIHPGWILRVRA